MHKARESLLIGKLEEANIIWWLGLTWKLEVRRNDKGEVEGVDWDPYLPSVVASSFVLKNNGAMGSSPLSSNWRPVTIMLFFSTAHIDCHLSSYKGDNQIGGKK